LFGIAIISVTLPNQRLIKPYQIQAQRLFRLSPNGKNTGVKGPLLHRFKKRKQVIDYKAINLN
jgi:hypothetical protein